MNPQIQPIVKATGDITAWGALIGWFVGVLPSVATGLTALWFAILILEKFTGKPFHEVVRCTWNKLRGR
mgnify:CR=1 FL=1